MSALMYDTQSDEIIALRALRSSIAAGHSHAILGAGYSSVTSSLVEQTTLDEIPQVSYWSSSPSLSSPAYPHFSRVWVSDTSAAALLIEILASKVQ